MHAGLVWSASLGKVLLTPLIARLTGSDDEVTRSLLCGLGRYLHVYAVRPVEKNLTVLSTHLSGFVVQLIVAHADTNGDAVEVVPSVLTGLVRAE